MISEKKNAFGIEGADIQSNSVSFQWVLRVGRLAAFPFLRLRSRISTKRVKKIWCHSSLRLLVSVCLSVSLSLFRPFRNNKERYISKNSSYIVSSSFKGLHHHHHVALLAQISLSFSRHPPYRPLLPAGLQGYIPYRYKAAVSRF